MPIHQRTRPVGYIAATVLSIALTLAASAAAAQATDPDAVVEPPTDAGSQPTAGQPPATEAATEEADALGAADAEAAAKPWTVICSEPEPEKPAICQMSQTIVNTETRQRVVTVSIRKQPQGLSMVLALPHGLHIPGGVSYQVDSGQTQRLPIEASDDKGVYAIAQVDDALITAMKRGATFKVNLMALNRRQISIPMTLAGFTAAADELAAAN